MNADEISEDDWGQSVADNLNEAFRRQLLRDIGALDVRRNQLLEELGRFEARRREEGRS